MAMSIGEQVVILYNPNLEYVMKIEITDKQAHINAYVKTLSA